MTCTAKASFNSHKPISPILRPFFSSSFGTAKTGPMPISSGSSPATAMPRYMPRGARPRFAASPASISTAAEAPSDSCEALPAVITAPSPRTGFNPCKPSKLVDGRLPSSFSNTTSWVEILPLSLSFIIMVDGRGTISSSNLPAACATAVRCWDCRAYSSCASREMP